MTDKQSPEILNERTIEIPVSMLVAEIAGWGESNMDLLENAEKDLDAVESLLTFINTPLKDRNRESLVRLAGEKLANARSRVQICHNELDCEREDAAQGGPS